MDYVNRTTLIENIARRTRRTRNPLRKRDVALVFDFLIELMAEELSKPDGRIGLMGVGILEVKPFKVRGQLRDIQSKEHILSGDEVRHRIHFRAANRIKEALREAECPPD